MLINVSLVMELSRVADPMGGAYSALLCMALMQVELSWVGLGWAWLGSVGPVKLCQLGSTSTHLLGLLGTLND